MPYSHPANVAPIMRRVAELRPSSVIDLGIGYGDYGLRVRELLPEALLMGVEAFELYRNARWSVYSGVAIENFSKQRYAGFDLVLLVDSLEHLEWNVAGITLAALISANERVIVSVPEGSYPQGAVNGNDFEVHRSQWTEEDLMRRGGRLLSRHVIDKGYGLVAEFGVDA